MRSSATRARRRGSVTSSTKRRRRPIPTGRDRRPGGSRLDAQTSTATSRSSPRRTRARTDRTEGPTSARGPARARSGCRAPPALHCRHGSGGARAALVRRCGPRGPAMNVAERGQRRSVRPRRPRPPATSSPRLGPSPGSVPVAQCCRWARSRCTRARPPLRSLCPTTTNGMVLANCAPGAVCDRVAPSAAQRPAELERRRRQLAAEGQPAGEQPGGGDDGREARQADHEHARRHVRPRSVGAPGICTSKPRNSPAPANGSASRSPGDRPAARTREVRRHRAAAGRTRCSTRCRRPAGGGPGPGSRTPRPRSTCRRSLSARCRRRACRSEGPSGSPKPVSNCVSSSVGEELEVDVVAHRPPRDARRGARRRRDRMRWRGSGGRPSTNTGVKRPGGRRGVTRDHAEVAQLLAGDAGNCRSSSPTTPRRSRGRRPPPPARRPPSTSTTASGAPVVATNRS